MPFTNDVLGDPFSEAKLTQKMNVSSAHILTSASPHDGSDIS